MIEVKKEGIILSKTTLGFENEGVLNPAIYQEGDIIHLFYRAVRMGNYSSIGYCKLNGPKEIIERLDFPILFPQHGYEEHGIEDPRIVKIDNKYYLTYTVYDGVNALGALATSDDLIHFEKYGIITPHVNFAKFSRLAEMKEKLSSRYFRYNNREVIKKKFHRKVYMWDKDLVFFPRRINNKLVYLHRFRPDIQIVYLNEITDLTKEFWENYFLNFHSYIVMEPEYNHEISYIGAGCPPIETKEGWLNIYHGVHDSHNGYVYTACASLLDLENPSKEIARLPYPLFVPEADWELSGYVNNVVFPTGTALFGDDLYIYYGAADERIACASLKLSELMNELLKNRRNHGQ